MILEQFSAGIVAASAAANGSVVAWITFNGTGTPAITASSSNVSSITDNGVGDYTINFGTNLPSANYSVAGSGTNTSDAIAAPYIHAASAGAAATTKTVSACRIYTGKWAGVIDSALNTVIFIN